MTLLEKDCGQSNWHDTTKWNDPLSKKMLQSPRKWHADIIADQVSFTAVDATRKWLQPRRSITTVWHGHHCPNGVALNKKYSRIKFGATVAPLWNTMPPISSFTNSWKILRNKFRHTKINNLGESQNYRPSSIRNKLNIFAPSAGIHVCGFGTIEKGGQTIIRKSCQVKWWLTGTGGEGHIQL